jgi:hypothetical protein
MGRSRSKPKSRRRRKRRPLKLRVPNWYYGLLIFIAVSGIGLIWANSRTSPINAENDYVLGDPNAPVTITDWGSFQ